MDGQRQPDISGNHFFFKLKDYLEETNTENDHGHFKKEKKEKDNQEQD